MSYLWCTGVPSPRREDFSPGLVSTEFKVVLGSPHRLWKLPQPLAPTEDSCNGRWTYMSHHMTKPTKWSVRPANTLISMGIRPVKSEYLVSAWMKVGSLAIHKAHSKDSDQTGWMPRLIRVFAGRTGHFVGFVTCRLIWFNDRETYQVGSQWQFRDNFPYFSMKTYGVVIH